MARRGIRSFWPYVLIGGGLAWAALYLGGVHPALALVPILPFMPHADARPRPVRCVERELPDTMNQFERWCMRRCS